MYACPTQLQRYLPPTACSETDCMRNAYDITTTGCFLEGPVTAATTEGVSEVL
jgi:hypothetical protein